MQHGGLGFGIMFALWIFLLQSLGTPLTMFPFRWLNMGSLYFTLIAIGKPSTIIGFAFSKITVSCLVTSIDSNPLDILML